MIDLPNIGALLDAGKYEEAAEVYLLMGLRGLFEARFDPDTVGDRTYREDLAYLLHAMDNALHASQTGTAEGIFRLALPLFDQYQSRRSGMPAAITEELVGDGYLMLGDERCLEHYEAAADRYDEIDPDPMEMVDWGITDGTMMAQTALWTTLERRGVDRPDDIELTADFHGRIEFKRSLATGL